MGEINKVMVFADVGGFPKEALVDSQRRVVVVIDGMSQEPSFSIEATNAAVPGNTDSTIVQYTPPVGFKFRITAVSGTGQSDAKFMLFINDVRQFTLRNSAANRNVQKEIGNPLEALAGQSTKFKVHHFKTPVREFSCTIEGFLFAV